MGTSLTRLCATWQAALCDRIIVLELGRVVEEGSHAELVAKGGRYYEMLMQGTGGSSPGISQAYSEGA